MKYSTRIKEIGSEALDFKIQDNLEFIIIFNDTAPTELREIAVIQEQTQLLDIPKVGDSLSIGRMDFEITAVGEEAINTLSELGHCTISFKGAPEVERPGIIEVFGKKLYPIDVKVDDYIVIR